MNFSIVLGIIISAILVGGLAVGLVYWKNHRRTTRHPLGQDVKLLRQPGEHLRKEWEKASELLGLWLCSLMVVPFFAFALPFGIPRLVPDAGGLGLLVAAFASGGAALIGGLTWGYRLIDRMQNLRLGWFGERAVADQLEVLKSQGYAVFHDVPCLGSTGAFNLDHVVVGQGRVVVVETKTRRKPKEHSNGYKVTYDGERLIWPWGPSTEELGQALDGAAWLRKELKKHLNLDVTVHAALTFPGWFVSGGPPKAPVLVENPQRLPSYVTGRFRSELSKQETDLVARHLRLLCAGLDYEAF